MPRSRTAGALVLGTTLAAGLLTGPVPTSTPAYAGLAPVAALPAPVAPSVGTTVRSLGDLSAGAVRGAALALTTTDRLVGVTWTTASAPVVRHRWRTAGTWGPWAVADTDGDDLEPAEAAGARPGTEPLWRPGGADRVELQVSAGAAVRAVRLVVVGDPPPVPPLPTRPRAEPTTRHGGETRSAAPAVLGRVRSRAEWGADERATTRRPAYASSVRAVVVHHTVQANDYAPADVPRMVRADWAYHVHSRGWGDVGYNLLVDRFGRVWEGRRGGVLRPVVGAHAQGFNTGTLGVALLGDHDRSPATTAALHAVARVAAAAGLQYRWDPRSSVTMTSGGSPRYARGRAVRVARVFGHRETGTTACPGRYVQPRLPDVRARAAALLGPAVAFTTTRVTGAPVHAPHPLAITVGLTREASWWAELKDPAGRVVARAAGRGTAVRLGWDGLVPAPPLPVAGPRTPALPVPSVAGTYTWSATASDGVHPPPGAVGGRVEVGQPDLAALAALAAARTAGGALP